MIWQRSGPANSRALWHIRKPDVMMARRDARPIFCGAYISGPTSAEPPLGGARCERCIDQRTEMIRQSVEVIAALTQNGERLDPDSLDVLRAAVSAAPVGAVAMATEA